MEINKFISGEIEQNALTALDNFKLDMDIEKISIFPDIHYCDEKALPVGVAFSSRTHIYPLITGKDMGCGVAYLKIDKSKVLPFNMKHYDSFDRESQKMTDEGLGGGNHFLSLEESETHFYIIVHTGSRNLGIEMFQRNRDILQSYDGVKMPIGDVPDSWWYDYNNILSYSKRRRFQFLEKSFQFLVKNKYVDGNTSYELADSCHNFIELNNGEVIHRKGATKIDSYPAVIPLSMARGSLIVKGNLYHPDYPKSLYSSSHGAGRLLSRTDTLKYWHSLKKSLKDWYKKQFPELVVGGDIPSSILQEFDFAYKPSENLLMDQPYLILLDQTKPIVTVKFNI